MNTDEQRKAAIDLISMVSAVTADQGMLASITSSGERSLQMFVRSAVHSEMIGAVLAPIKISDSDSFCFEFAMRSWRADLVVFHQDGSATVVEMKDGAKGLSAVLAGIGQVGLYGTLLGLAGGVKKVRRALMWTPISNDGSMDRLVDQACEDAGVTPLFMPSMDDIHKERLVAIARSVAQLVEEHRRGAP